MSLIQREKLNYEQDDDGGLSKHVVTPDQQPGSPSIWEIIDLTTTRQKQTYPSGARWLTISARLEPGETATANQMYFYCLNAASDADAAGKLATQGARMVLFQGDDHHHSFTSADPLTRIDIVAAEAVGSEETRVLVVAGVI